MAQFTELKNLHRYAMFAIMKKTLIEEETGDDVYPRLLKSQTLEEAMEEARGLCKGELKISKYDEPYFIDSKAEDFGDGGCCYVVQVEGVLDFGTLIQEMQQEIEQAENMTEDERCKMVRRAKFEKARKEYESLKNEFEDDVSVSTGGKSRSKRGKSAA